MLKILVIGATVWSLAGPIWASSDQAWEAFRADVRERCASLVVDAHDAAIAIEVNPFGSGRYGAALVTVDRGAAGVERMVCIYDKATKGAELTGPFAAASAPGQAPPD